MSNTVLNNSRELGTSANQTSRPDNLFRFKSPMPVNQEESGAMHRAGSNTQGRNPGETQTPPIKHAAGIACDFEADVAKQISDRVRAYPGHGMFGLLAAKL